MRRFPAPSALRPRLIFLFRLLKVDTVISYDSWAHYEENPDHYVTASAVEAACWMSGMSKDYPEHLDAERTAFQLDPAPRVPQRRPASSFPLHSRARKPGNCRASS